MSPTNNIKNEDVKHPKDARDMLKVDPKNREVSRRFSLPHLTAYSVYWLNLWEIPTTYENISVLNARLFPDAFAFKGFPEIPDAMRTNRTLMQMRPKYRNFATSDPRRGVYLTEKGRHEADRVIEVLGQPTFEGKPINVTLVGIDPRRPSKTRERTRNPAQIIEKARSRLLFRRYKEGRFSEMDVVHLLGLVELYDHTPPAEIRKEFKQLRIDAVAANDKEFVEFLDVVAERFSSYLNRPNPIKKKEVRNASS